MTSRRSTTGTGPDRTGRPAGPRRRALATVLTAALFAATAGPAAAQSTTAPTTQLPGSGATTSPSSTTTLPVDPTAPTSTQPVLTAEQAGPGILLDAADRVELAQTLAEATDDTDVCFGYQVSLSGSGAADRDEVLSNDGPDQRPGGPSCAKGYVVVNVSLNYTSSSSESEDSAGWSVVTDVPGLTGSEATKRLEGLTGVSDGDLLGNDDDLALRNLTAALPLVLDGAEPAEETAVAPTGAAPNDDRLTGSPGSDWIRAHGVGIAIAVGLLLVALFLLVRGFLGTRKGEDAGPSKAPPSTTTTP
ncbi:hypothetical protein [Patulibacter minatonensis]|uniref:hypothetical protein n=1 Tax=Patulibacter minatonensis TaxID=298163 RepID=UPI00047E3ABF|nr:hypothetical protein [Patulibacter minatonensis]